MEKILIGAGGHANEVKAQMRMPDIKCFVDDKYVKDGLYPISQIDPTKHEAMVAIGNSHDRMLMVEKLPKELTYFTFIHESAQIFSNVKIGEGSFIGAGCILTCDISIGKHALLNRCVQIGHDCKISDYFSAMPGVIISGNVTIFDCVFIGTNTSIREGVSISPYNSIGMQSCIIEDIRGMYGVYGGIPTKLLYKRDLKIK